MERNVSVRTPESISFYYELAGLGSRFLAVAIDHVIQVALGIAFLLLAVWAAPAAAPLSRALHVTASSYEAITFGITIAIEFLVLWGYFVAFENLWQGQTPGKRLIGIRVVRDGGYPITFIDSAIRNFIRVIELVFAYVPSIISALVSPTNKRLGDLAAGTIVVRDRAFEVTDAKAWLAGDAGASEAPAIDGFEKVTDEEHALAQRYVERSHLLEPRAAQETAGRIAAALRPKLGPEAAALSDHELLVRIAAGHPR